MTYVAQLGTYACGFEAGNLPQHIVERLKCCLLYNLSMGVASYAADDTTWNAIRALNSAGGDASLLVTGERRAPQEAAFANAALITARGQNDTLRDAVGHVGCIVIPAVMALAEARQASIATLLAALSAGYETQAKVACGAAPLAVKRGFRATPVFGVFGSAAGAARVLGLDPDRTAHALAIASNFAAGTMQCWAEGTMEWRIQVANASRAGVVAALLAEAGIRGAAQALEGDCGFFRAFSSEVPPLRLDGWGIERVMFKPYPGCAINQGPLHALMTMLRQHDVPRSDVTGLTVTLSPEQIGYPGVANVGPFTSPSGAVMSTAFMLTMALRDGVLYQRHFLQEYGDGDIHAASRMVELESDASVAGGSSRVAMRLRDGRTLHASCVDEDEFVFNWEQTTAIVRPLSAELNSDGRGDMVASLIDALPSIEHLGCATDLMALCHPGKGQV